jgi:hypothetical protein
MKQIKDFPDYSITFDGVIINTKKGTIKSIQTNYKNGYQSTILYNNNNCKRLYIHRLVALHYIDNPFNKKEVNHIDGNKKNNNVLNLEWATKSENNLHSWKIRTTKQHLSKMVLNLNTGVFYDSIKEASFENKPK